MTTLTDRYVAETLRGIPQRQRADIEAELRTLIADAIDDNLEPGSDATTVEIDVLTELGSPRKLAARYSDRPAFLIGPELYLDYVRVLTVLLSTVVPSWFLFSGVVTFVAGSGALEAFGAALYGALETGITIAFFTTIVFAVIERSRRRGARREAVWNPTSLPEVRDKRGYFAELVGGTLFLVLIASALIVLQTVTTIDGQGPIEPGLWASGVFYIALFYAIASICFHIFTWYTGASAASAIATVALDVLFVVPAVWLAASGRLLNPAYFEPVGVSDGASFGWTDGRATITTVIIAVVVLLSTMDAINAIVRAVRGHRGAR